MVIRFKKWSIWKRREECQSLNMGTINLTQVQPHHCSARGRAPPSILHFPPTPPQLFPLPPTAPHLLGHANFFSNTTLSPTQKLSASLLIKCKGQFKITKNHLRHILNNGKKCNRNCAPTFLWKVNKPGKPSKRIQFTTIEEGRYLKNL